MTHLTKAEVEHIATLARLQLSPEETEKMTKDLGSILHYVDVLQEVNVDGVEPTAQVTGATNVFRADEVIASQASAEELLECSPLPIDDRQIVTPSAHG